MQDTDGLGRLNAELEELKRMISEERGQQPELRRLYMAAKEAAVNHMASKEAAVSPAEPAAADAGASAKETKARSGNPENALLPHHEGVNKRTSFFARRNKMTPINLWTYSSAIISSALATLDQDSVGPCSSDIQFCSLRPSMLPDRGCDM